MSRERVLVARATLAKCEGDVEAAARTLDVDPAWLRCVAGPHRRGPGRPRNTEADDLIARALRDLPDATEAEVVRLVRDAGYAVSRGTIRRRIAEARGRVEGMRMSVCEQS